MNCKSRLQRRPTSGLLTATVVLALLASSTVLRAQDTGQAVMLTVDEAVARAMETSHRLAAARADEAGAEALVDVRRAARMPTVTAAAGYSRTNHVDVFGIPQPDGTLRVVYPDIPDNFNTRLGLAWPIYTGGRTGALEAAARAEAGASALDRRAAEADLRLEVVRAYWALVTAGETVRVLDEALARADAHVKDVKSRFDAGLVPPNEVLTAEAERAHEEMLLIEARNTHAASLVDIRRLTGIPEGTAVSPAERLAPSAAAAVDGAGLVAEALANRPERQALEQRLDAAEAGTRAAAAGRLPSVAVSAGVDYANPNPRIFPREDRWRDSWDVGVNVSVPLWDGGRTGADTARAAAAVTATRERLAELDNVVTAEVRQRLLDVDSSRAAVTAAEKGVTAATEARRVVAERYAVGVITSTEVIDAEVALLRAELDRTRALAAVRLAEARLDRALGRQ